jgi:hypothetical protein
VPAGRADHQDVSHSFTASASAAIICSLNLG